MGRNLIRPKTLCFINILSSHRANPRDGRSLFCNFRNQPIRSAGLVDRV